MTTDFANKKREAWAKSCSCLECVETGRNHTKNTDFFCKPLDKQQALKYINHRMLALLNDEC